MSPRDHGWMPRVSAPSITRLVPLTRRAQGLARKTAGPAPASLDELADRITAFEARYNQAAEPFDWRFTRDDLDHLLHRIAA